VLDDFGLAAALRLYVESLRADGWELTYREALGSARLPPPIETVIFRVAMEALTNVRKHARTTRAHLELEREAQSVRLLVQDWGCGFELAAAPAKARLGERIGLRGMRERIEMLGGSWSVESRPGAGTLIVATVPLPATEGETPYGS
jgi:signal transduction histidine kinase